MHPAMGKIAHQHQKRVRSAGTVPRRTGTGSAYEQDGTRDAAPAGREDLRSIDDIAGGDLFHGRAEAGGLTGYERLGLATPARPDFPALQDPCEPAALLCFVTNPVNQRHGVDVTFPTARERKVRLGEALRQHPQSKGIPGVRLEPEPTPGQWNGGPEQTCLV